MKKITKNFRKEEDKIIKKHNAEIIDLMKEMVSQIQAILIPGKVYDLIHIKRVITVEPVWKITTITHEGPISVGGKKLSWDGLDIFYLQYFIEVINLKSFKV